jgi:hypothetical protein
MYITAVARFGIITFLAKREHVSHNCRRIVSISVLLDELDQQGSVCLQVFLEIGQVVSADFLLVFFARQLAAQEACRVFQEEQVTHEAVEGEADQYQQPKEDEHVHFLNVDVDGQSALHPMCLLIGQDVDLKLAEGHARESVRQLPVVRAEQQTQNSDRLSRIERIAQPVVEQEELNQRHRQVEELNKKVAYREEVAVVKELVFECALDELLCLTAVFVGLFELETHLYVSDDVVYCRTIFQVTVVFFEPLHVAVQVKA